MNIHFKYEELVITGNSVPLDVATKLMNYHIIPVSRVREALGLPMTASLKSGYRPHEWEISHGRDGNSQHTFTGKGAIDWTCKYFVKNKQTLLALILEHTDYTRMAVYNSFIHCDYKPTSTGNREIYTSTPDSKWTLKKLI
jgi:hypothetical protein